MNVFQNRFIIALLFNIIMLYESLAENATKSNNIFSTILSNIIKNIPEELTGFMGNTEASKEPNLTTEKPMKTTHLVPTKTDLSSVDLKKSEPFTSPASNSFKTKENTTSLVVTSKIDVGNVTSVTADSSSVKLSVVTHGDVDKTTVSKVSDFEDEIDWNDPDVVTFQAYYHRYLDMLTDEEKVGVGIREKCRRNTGGDKVYDKVLIKQLRFRDCVHDLLDVEEMKSDLKYTYTSVFTDQYLNEYCRKYHKIHTCLETYVRYLKPCLNSTERQNINAALAMMIPIRDFICFHDDVRQTEIVVEDYIKCVDSFQEIIQKCSEEASPEPLFDMGTTVWNVPLDILQKECKKYSKIRHCVMDRLRVCQYDENHNFGIDILELFTSYLPCNITTLNKTQLFSDEETEIPTESPSGKANVDVPFWINFLLLVALSIKL